jgi:carboxyl-terminal processing protease
MPDIFVSIDTSLFTRGVTRLYLDGRFNNFVYKYYTNNLPLFEQYKTPSDLVNKFQNADDVWNQLVTYAMKDSINLTKVPANDKEDIQHRIKAYLARLKWRTQGFYEVYNQYDLVIKKAKETLAK